MSYQYDPIQRKCTIRNAAELPNEIFAIAKDIEILDASFGNLTSLPDNLSDLTNLRIAFFSNNDFDSIPEVLSSCQKLEMVGFKSCKINQLDTHALPAGLRGLILTDNLLTELPESIGSYAQLQKLMLTGNRIQALPTSLLDCGNLGLLRISMNQLQESPDWLFQLPKLAWYGDSSNPFRLDAEKATLDRMREIPWDDVEIIDTLGQSAKNIVYSARCNDQHVAIKLFGAGISADGNAIDEMQASLIAGSHSNTIGGIARIMHNPEGREGLVMPMIPADYKALGQPPDFTTLTRDVFSIETPLTEDFISQVALDIASAMTHVSSQGVMHGDIYAHNILSRADGKSVIGDFGAASTYIPQSTPGLLRERTDVRGFGYLLVDLLAHSEPSAVIKLSKLKDACLDEIPSHRPLFKDIFSALSSQH